MDDLYRRLVTQENLSHRGALGIYEMLHREAVSLGAINSENMLDGLDVDLRITDAVNSVGL